MTSVIIEGFVIGVLASVIGPVPRSRAREGPAAAVRRVRHRPAARQHRLRDAHDRRVADRRHVVTVLASTVPGDPRDARRADRGRPRGRAAAVAPRALRAARRVRHARASPLALLLFGAPRPRRVHRPSGCSRSGSACVASFVGMALLAPTLVPPLASALGWPATRIGGVAGNLARENSMRNPARTASTAAALMIGLALVSAVGVLAAGHQGDVRERRRQAVHRRLRAHVAERLHADRHRRRRPRSAMRRGVTVVSGVRGGDGKAFGSRIQVTGVEPERRQASSASTWIAGGPACQHARRRRRVRRQGVREGSHS